MDRWLWLCPPIGIAGAVVTVKVFGLTWLSALGVAFLIACPALVVWTLREARATRQLRDRLLNDIDETRRTHG
jgi:Flp pilus assembly protein TadB